MPIIDLSFFKPRIHLYLFRYRTAPPLSAGVLLPRASAASLVAFLNPSRESSHAVDINLDCSIYIAGVRCKPTFWKIYLQTKLIIGNASNTCIHAIRAGTVGGTLQRTQLWHAECAARLCAAGAAGPGRRGASKLSPNPLRPASAHLCPSHPTPGIAVGPRGPALGPHCSGVSASPADPRRISAGGNAAFAAPPCSMMRHFASDSRLLRSRPMQRFSATVPVRAERGAPSSSLLAPRSRRRRVRQRRIYPSPGCPAAYPAL